jgi:diguanylate cyclase (GGDEF)-like protein
MKELFAKVAMWIFLGNHTLKKSTKMENTMRVITLNMIALLGSIYASVFLPTVVAHNIHPFAYIILLSIFVIAFIVVHTERGLKYFDYVRIVVIGSAMIVFGLLYADTSYGYVWTFLLPLMIIFVMELKLGLICCIVYYVFMVVVEFKTGKCGADMFARYSCVFWAQSALIATYETFRSMTRDRLLKDKEEVEYLSVTDHLTKLYNRRYFSESIEREFEKAANQNENLCFLMIDADHFKKYNDTYGHLQGDAMLVSIARVLKKVTRRSGDLVFRMGGEEFAILLPNTAYKWALSFAEKVRLEIAEMKVPLINRTEETRTTVSIGIACIIPRPGESSEILMKLADKNLYKAKETGRNRVVG